MIPVSANTLASTLAAPAQGGAPIRIVGGRVAILGGISDDPANPTAGAFLGALPLELRMTRLRDRECYARLPETLSSDGPRQNRFSDGDIGYPAVFDDNHRDPHIRDLPVIGRVISASSVRDGLGLSRTPRLERAGAE